MIIDFDIPNDGKMHRYCPNCFADGVGRARVGGKVTYPCGNCGADNTRTIYFNTHKFWIDHNRELWHESSGVFVRNSEGKYLFYKRNEFPFALTVPSGHVDKGETPKEAARRELSEETNIAGKLELLGVEDVQGDSCSAGADIHRWSAFLMRIQSTGDNTLIFDEGDKAIWLSPDQALEQGAVFVVDYMIKKYFIPS